MRLRVKITVCMIWLLSVAFGIGGSLMISSSFSAAVSQEKRACEQSYGFIVKTVQMVNSISTLPNRSDIAEVLRQMQGMGSINFDAARMEASGEVFYSFGPNDLPYTGESRVSVVEVGDKHYCRVSGTITTESDALIFTAFKDISSIYEMRDGQYRTYAVVFAATVMVGALVSYLISRLITKPLEKLTGATKKLAEGELSYRCGIDTLDETGELSRSFDAMALRLEENVEQLRDAMRRQEEFMGSFAHEMKTPMTSIIGYADLLRSGSLGTEEQMEAANYIFSEGKRLESLSQKLLDIIVLKNTELDLRPASPARLIESTVQYLRPIYEKSGITMQCACADGECLLEPDLVRSLLVNLLDNAKKALDGGGRIVISSEMCDDGCIIRVHDNGRGIPQDSLRHLTEAFYRVDKSRSRAQGGAGLGLALCSDIARLHNGSIEFESSAENGTCVIVGLHGGAV